MAEALARELRLALAQVERISRNAHDQAESHTALVDLLLLRGAGDIDAALRLPRARHLADAEAEIVAALGLDD